MHSISSCYTTQQCCWVVFPNNFILLEINPHVCIEIVYKAHCNNIAIRLSHRDCQGILTETTTLHYTGHGCIHVLRLDALHLFVEHKLGSSYANSSFNNQRQSVLQDLWSSLRCQVFALQIAMKFARKILSCHLTESWDVSILSHISQSSTAIVSEQLWRDKPSCKISKSFKQAGFLLNPYNICGNHSYAHSAIAAAWKNCQSYCDLEKIQAHILATFSVKRIHTKLHYQKKLNSFLSQDRCWMSILRKVLDMAVKQQKI